LGALPTGSLGAWGLIIDIKERELPIFRDRYRIFVFLSEKVLLKKDVNGGRRRVRIFALICTNGSGVLGAAENELFFLFPLRHLFPGGEGRRHENRHHGHRH
jgi:hypothetical protein